jgi:cytochrome d ubiquinol oxidase subunit I
MTYSTLWLSQLQFYTSLGFMLMFLVIELGLAWILLYFKVRSLGPGPAPWTAAYRFWVRVFALAFILSFAASLPVLIQFGSLWPALMDKIGDVAGPLLAAALLSTFIFKSCFLGAMLFGQRYVSDKVHTLLVFMVALGVLITSFWLLVLVSWMHAPAGVFWTGSQYQVISWWQIVLNPAMPWYAGLFVLTSAVTVAFVMMGVVAAQSIGRPVDDSGRLVFHTAVYIAVAALVLLIVVTAGTGAMTAAQQPAKAAAVAAQWHSGSSGDLVVFAWPDTQTGLNRASWVWQDAGAVWLGRDGNGNVRGLDQFSGMTPPVVLTFWSFRIAVLVGMLMAITAGLTLWRARRLRFDAGALSLRWRHWLVGMKFSGWALLLAGLAYIMMGSFPYAITGVVTLSEVAGNTSFKVLMAGYAVYMVFYGVLLVGFFQLLRHIGRYGVVPIARRRGRA